MHRKDVEIGKVYTAKVSGRLVTVKITKDRGTTRRYAYNSNFSTRETHTGWDAINQDTGRQVHIPTAARLRGEYRKPRCGACTNCLAIVAEKVKWTGRYRDAVDSGRPTSHDEMATLREGWKQRVAELPCTGNVIAVSSKKSFEAKQN